MAGERARGFGRDLKVIGQSMRIEGVPVTLVGGSPPEFTSPPGGRIADITMAVGVMFSSTISSRHPVTAQP